jgi:hypothetical protein
MDADDMCDPGRLRTQVEYLDEHSEVDLVGSNLLSIGNNSRVSGRRRLPTTHEDICPGPLGMVQLCHPSVMFRKKWALAHPYPTNFNRAEDAALWQSSCHESRFANIPEPLFFYREYETFSFTKYYKSKLTGIKIMWTFGRKDAGLWQLVIGVFLRLGRIAAYGMLTLLGLQGIALAKRSQAAEADDLEKYQRALMIIRQTSVPGLSQED